MLPSKHKNTVDDIELAWWEWNPHLRGTGPTLFFTHASGFNARVFDPLIAALPECHAIAVDLHGHGSSSGGPITHWSVLASELASLVEKLDIADAIGIGHSVGGHALLRCAAAISRGFSRLILFDPVIMSPDFYANGESHFDTSKPHPASRRKAHFDSADAMIDLYRDRIPYCHFSAEAFESYCRHGLKPSADGDGVVLACSPEMEASIYTSASASGDIIKVAQTVSTPTLVVRARQSEEYDFLSSPTWPGLANHLPKGEDLLRAEMTHFHPLQDPADAARIVSDFASLAEGRD